MWGDAGNNGRCERISHSARSPRDREDNLWSIPPAVRDLLPATATATATTTVAPATTAATLSAISSAAAVSPALIAHLAEPLDHFGRGRLAVKETSKPASAERYARARSTRSGEGRLGAGDHDGWLARKVVSDRHLSILPVLLDLDGIEADVGASTRAHAIADVDAPGVMAIGVLDEGDVLAILDRRSAKGQGRIGRCARPADDAGGSRSAIACEDALGSKNFILLR
jgi:hypothetical protein